MVPVVRNAATKFLCLLPSSQDSLERFTRQVNGCTHTLYARRRQLLLKNLCPRPFFAGTAVKMQQTWTLDLPHPKSRWVGLVAILIPLAGEGRLMTLHGTNDC